MKPFTSAGLRAPWLAGCILLLASVLSAAGSASAASLLFLPESGKFPYHLSGQSTGFEGRFVILTLGGVEFLALDVDSLASVLNATSFELHLLLLQADMIGGGGGTACGTNEDPAGNVLVNLLGHLGLADPGGHPAGLLLFPAGIAIKCKTNTVLVRGSSIGLISLPATGVAAELLKFLFKQTKANQEFTSFLLAGGGLLTNRTLETAIHGGFFGTGEFEKSAIQIQALPLKSLSGEGKFTLVLDP